MAAGNGSMFENGVQDTSDVCYQPNDAGRIEVYCIEPSSNGPETTSYGMKCATTAIQSTVMENCLADVASSALVKNAYCMESRPEGDQLPDTYQFVTSDGQYQMSVATTVADSAEDLYRIEAAPGTYQLNSSGIDISQAGPEVGSKATAGGLVLQCVEYVDSGGGARCDGGGETTTFQGAAPAVMEDSYEIVVLADGSRVLRKIKPAPNAAGRLGARELEVVEAADSSELVAGNSAVSPGVVADQSRSSGGPAAVVMAAGETPTCGGSSYIILPSTLVSKSALDSSPSTVIYQLPDGTTMIQGKWWRVLSVKLSVTGCMLLLKSIHFLHFNRAICRLQRIWEGSLVG